MTKFLGTLLLLAVVGILNASDAYVRDNGVSDPTTSTEATTEVSTNLKCYQCGTFSYSGDGSVSPCRGYTAKDLKPCQDNESHCVKYVNEGIVVRQCVPECKTGSHSMIQLYCCQEDGCNGAEIAVLEMMTFLITFVLVTYTLCH